MDETTKDLEKVFLHIYNPGLSKDKIIMAESGKILHSKNEKTGIESFNLLLKDGNIVDSSVKNSDIEKILFKEYTLPISEQRFSYTPATKEIMMNRRELKAFIDAGLEAALKRRFKKKDYFNAHYEYWNRFNTPVLCLLLTFLGFGLGIKATRGRGKNSSGRAILLLIGYYVVFFSMVSVARDGNIPILVAMIIPAVLLAGFSYKIYRDLDWQS